MVLENLLCNYEVILAERLSKLCVRSRSVNPPKERSIPQQQSTEHLVNQSYAEQLQRRLHDQMISRMMSETFM